MKRDLTTTNVTFGFLKGSSPFLNAILDNLDCGILLLDRELRIRAFNDPFKCMFSNEENADNSLLFLKCGQALGCSAQIEEKSQCGKTTKCQCCELRNAALQSYNNDQTIYNQSITKSFIDCNNKKVEKQIQFSTRLFTFKENKYIIMLVQDITNTINPENN